MRHTKSAPIVPKKVGSAAKHSGLGNAKGPGLHQGLQVSAFHQPRQGPQNLLET